MRIVETAIAGPLIIEPDVFADERGLFFESWNARKFADAGIDSAFVQDNHSRSHKGVVRGLHYQNPNAQGKLVRVVAGSIFDVAVDLRRSSATFGKSVGAELDAIAHRMFWVPPGFAHGFLALQDNTDVLYKCSAAYAPEDEHTLLWDDPALAIDWPLDRVGKVTVSERDAAGLPLSAIRVFA